MKISRAFTLAVSALAITSLPIAATTYAKKPVKKGYAMKKKMAPKPTKNIVETAVATPDLSTLVAAVTAAGLVDTLASPGPFTVFAPTNAAFAKLPAGTVETLVKPENKATLTSILTYHVIAGKFTSTDVMAAIRKGGGKAVLPTVNGGTLTATMQGKHLVLTDAKGGKSTVKMADFMQTNGVVHVIDTVVMP
jgi:uncharacterized surface protein with fasciclin (FAS1) repeats